MHFLLIKKQSLYYYSFILFAIITCFYLLFSINSSVESVANSSQLREISIITTEFKTKTADGQVMEAYRWDPGTIYIKEDEKVLLRMYGVNGKEHPFIIEGTDVKGTVKKGEDTVIELQLKEGIYRLVCLTHPDKESNGPMIATIVVD